MLLPVEKANGKLEKDEKMPIMCMWLLLLSAFANLTQSNSFMSAWRAHWCYSCSLPDLTFKLWSWREIYLLLYRRSHAIARVNFIPQLPLQINTRTALLTCHARPADRNFTEILTASTVIFIIWMTIIMIYLIFPVFTLSPTATGTWCSSFIKPLSPNVLSHNV